MTMNSPPDRSKIEQVILRDYDDNFAPANSQMVVQLIGGTIFMEIQKPGFGDLKELPETVAEFAISKRIWDAAMSALQVRP